MPIPELPPHYQIPPEGRLRKPSGNNASSPTRGSEQGAHSLRLDLDLYLFPLPSPRAMGILTPLDNLARLQLQISHCQLSFHTALKSRKHPPLNSYTVRGWTATQDFSYTPRRTGGRKTTLIKNAQVLTLLSAAGTEAARGPRPFPLFLSIHPTPTSLPILPSSPRTQHVQVFP